MRFRSKEEEAFEVIGDLCEVPGTDQVNICEWDERCCNDVCGTCSPYGKYLCHYSHTSYYYPTDPDKIRLHLEENEAIWNAAGPPLNYKYTFSNYCWSCPSGHEGEFEVEVQDGDILSVTLIPYIYSDYDGLDVIDPPKSAALTVPELFQKIRDAIASDAAAVDTYYNLTLGFPEYLYIDYDQCSFDDNKTFYISNLVVAE